MKTSITVDPIAHKEAKVICAQNGEKIGDYATQALVEKNERERSCLGPDEVAISHLKRGSKRKAGK